MRLPQAAELPSSTETIGAFGGYDHRDVISNGYLYDMRNLTSDRYPIISPRPPRGIVRTLTKPNGLFALNGLCWVDGTSLYFDGEVKGTVSDSPKQFVAMGAYIVIFPDKVRFNTEDGTVEALEASVTTSTQVTAMLCKVDGSAYNITTKSDTAPAEPEDGEYWLDTSQTPHVLRQYSDLQMSWVAIPTTYVSISATGIGTGFAEGDGVEISGMTDDTLNGSFILYGAQADSIIITGIIDESIEQTAAVTVKRTVPDMDYVTQLNNRIWGCSSEKHEIYACKQGDPKNWNVFQGVSTDSYALTIGSAGDFTGACSHLGYVIFFKEDTIHKIYGSKPANYQLTDLNARGVEKGSEKSLVVVNETLIYKSRWDVCAYASALPQSISAVFGTHDYHSAAAGALEGKYYVSMQRDDGVWKLMVYDTENGMWHLEDDTHAIYFAAWDGELYYLDADGAMYAVMGAEGTAEARVPWMVQFGEIGLELPECKYVSRLTMRFGLDEGALMRVEVQYDTETEYWQEVWRTSAPKRRAYVVPILPRRCDTMRIRLTGYGGMQFYSITKTLEQGGDA